MVRVNSCVSSKVRCVSDELLRWRRQFPALGDVDAEDLRGAGRAPHAVHDRPAVGFGAGAVDADVRTHHTLVEAAVLRVAHVGGQDFDLIRLELFEDA